MIDLNNKRIFTIEVRENDVRKYVTGTLQQLIGKYSGLLADGKNAEIKEGNKHIDLNIRTDKSLVKALNAAAFNIKEDLQKQYFEVVR